MSNAQNIESDMDIDIEEDTVLESNSFLHIILRILFSTPGLVLLVVIYSVVGALIFPLLEAPTDIQNTLAVTKSRDECLKELWTITERLNVLYERNWTMLVHEQLRRFEGSIIKATKGGLTETMTDQRLPRWSFSESLLYSITVITTIGHGELTPKTSEGKIVTMLYALIGVPLMLMCLSSLGGFLADALECVYLKMCCINHHQYRQNTNIKNTSFGLTSRNVDIDDGDDDDIEDHGFNDYNRDEQKRSMQRETIKINCNLCKYNGVCRDSLITNSYTGDDPYHLLQNSPTKSILSTSHHASPQKSSKQLEKQHLIQYQPKQQLTQSLNHCHAHSAISTSSPSNHLIEIQQNIGNLISTGSIASTHSYFPINRFPYETPQNIIIQKQIGPNYCQNQPQQLYINQQLHNQNFQNAQLPLPQQQEQHKYHQTQQQEKKNQNQQKLFQPQNQIIYLQNHQIGNNERQDQHSLQLQHFPTATVHGLGRSKFLPKPLPQEINMLISECDLSCHHDMSEKSSYTTSLSTTSSAVAPSEFTTTSNTTTATALGIVTAVSSAATAYDNDGNNMEKLDEDDEEDNRINCSHGTPSRVPLIRCDNQMAARQMKICDFNGEEKKVICGKSNCLNRNNSELVRSERLYASQVPITIIFIILISYICIGTFIFSIWENWSMVDGAYFCFVTLSTIGFGDLVPKRTFHGPDVQLFACCAYLLLGLVLVAMSFTLLETQLIWKCKRMAVRLKLAKA